MCLSPILSWFGPSAPLPSSIAALPNLDLSHFSIYPAHHSPTDHLTFRCGHRMRWSSEHHTCNGCPSDGCWSLRSESLSFPPPRVPCQVPRLFWGSAFSWPTSLTLYSYSLFALLLFLASLPTAQRTYCFLNEAFTEEPLGWIKIDPLSKQELGTK